MAIPKAESKKERALDRTRCGARSSFVPMKQDPSGKGGEHPYRRPKPEKKDPYELPAPPCEATNSKLEARVMELLSEGGIITEYVNVYSKPILSECQRYYHMIRFPRWVDNQVNDDPVHWGVYFLPNTNGSEQITLFCESLKPRCRTIANGKYTMLIYNYPTHFCLTGGWNAWDGPFDFRYDTEIDPAFDMPLPSKEPPSTWEDKKEAKKIEKARKLAEKEENKQRQRGHKNRKSVSSAP